MSSLGKKSRHLVILGAGKPHFGVSPSALIKTSTGHNQLQWLLAATSSIVDETVFIGGYCDYNIIESFPKLKVITNINWKKTGSFGSLLTAPLGEIDEMFVSYSDILFHSNLMNSFEKKEADIIVAHDSLWLSRYPNRDQFDIETREQVNFSSDKIIELGYNLIKNKPKSEFIGLVWFSKKATSYLSSLSTSEKQELKFLSLSQGINSLLKAGFSASGIDVEGNWAELRNIVDIRKFVLGTKAETLNNLRGVIQGAIILDQINFTVKDWKSNKQDILSKINRMFSEKLLAVRSSASSEDGFEHSNAGAFFSKLNVKPGPTLDLAINEVIASYKTAFEHEQILIQPMLEEVAVSGVVFSRTLVKLAPWYVINYENSPDTTLITSGNSSEHKTIYVTKNSLKFKIPFDTTWKKKLIDVVAELEKMLGFDELDIEFAVDKNDRIYLLQVRPLTSKVQENQIDDSKFFEAIENAKDVWLSHHNNNLEIPQIFGVMPDWNPAEIIGASPGELAKSLYSYLITDEIWAQQRSEFGYRHIQPSALLVEFLGQPYVNVNLSFESLIPAKLNDKLAGRLLRFYLNWLSENPKLHDKIEFEVVPNCLTSNFTKWEKRLSGEFNSREINELKYFLTEITNEAFNRVDFHLSQIEILKDRLAEYQTSKISAAPLIQIKDILQDCKKLGTLPFAHLARCGFIAMSLLKDAQEAGIISQKAIDSFLSSVNTVAKDFYKDAGDVKRGYSDVGEFINKYGHLRPGTYDITSPRYQDHPEIFILPIIENFDNQSKNEKEPSDWINERNCFFNSLEEIGLPNNPKVVESFLRKSISGREYAKFIFTRHLSFALEEIVKFGETFGLTKIDLSNLNLNDILYLADDASNSTMRLNLVKQKIRQNQINRDISEAAELPNLIIEPANFHIFTLGAEEPNFIGSIAVTAPCQHINDNSSQKQSDLSGKVVIIPRADPGYDWLINCDIAGLITLYGGANSHMAIRCAEFGISAAIGVGKKRYDAISAARSIILDPANSLIRVL